MNKYKYPRTLHIPQSHGKTTDDKVLKNMDKFYGMDVVITEKMDGENTTVYANGEMHARSIDGKSHESRDWVKANVCPLAPSILIQVLGERICGENMYAKHSIAYKDLKSYFYVFSYIQEEEVQSWGLTEVVAEEFGLPTPAVLYSGILTETVVNTLIKSLDFTSIEGFVIRNKDAFLLKDFKNNVCKYVRNNHVQTDKHWMHQKVVKNEIRL